MSFDTLPSYIRKDNFELLLMSLITEKGCPYGASFFACMCMLKIETKGVVEIFYCSSVNFFPF